MINLINKALSNNMKAIDKELMEICEFLTFYGRNLTDDVELKHRADELLDQRIEMMRKVGRL